MPPRARKKSSGGTRRSARGAEAAAVRAIETAGSSKSSWDDAVLRALRAARAQGEPVSFQVVHLAGDVGADGIRSYRATLKVGLRQRLTGS